VSSLSPDPPRCICNAGLATGWPVITTVSLAQAKHLCHADELVDDRTPSFATARPNAARRFRFDRCCLLVRPAPGSHDLDVQPSASTQVRGFTARDGRSTQPCHVHPDPAAGPTSPRRARPDRWPRERSVPRITERCNSPPHGTRPSTDGCTRARGEMTHLQQRSFRAITIVRLPVIIEISVGRLRRLVRRQIIPHQAAPPTRRLG